jgi:oligoribonuclease (3'-5' exoribonuclease)
VSKPNYERLFWCDLETVGGDENVDPIIEVGVVLTEIEPPFEEVWRYKGVCAQRDDRWLERLALEPEIIEMHAANGLTEEVKQVSLPGRGDREGTTFGLQLAEHEEEIIRELISRGHTKNRRLLLAGSGVAHFDRRFIRAQMPRLDLALHYAALDVGALRRMLQLVDREDLVPKLAAKDLKPHRGLDDAVLHLQEWRLYAGMLAQLQGEADWTQDQLARVIVNLAERLPEVPLPEDVADCVSWAGWKAG